MSVGVCVSVCVCVIDSDLGRVCRFVCVSVGVGNGSTTIESNAPADNYPPKKQARRMVQVSCRGDDEPLAVLVVVLPGTVGAATGEARRWQPLAQLVREETKQTFVAVRCVFVRIVMVCVCRSGRSCRCTQQQQQQQQMCAQVFTPLAATNATFRTALFKCPPSVAAAVTGVGGAAAGGLGANMASAALWEIKGAMKTVGG